MIIGENGAKNQGNTSVPAPRNKQSPSQQGSRSNVGPVTAEYGAAHCRSAFPTPQNPSGPDQVAKKVCHSPLRLD